jgi:hypothetical protein
LTDNDSPAAAICVGVTGHRKLGDDPRVVLRVEAECVRALDKLRDVAHQFDARLLAYSALAIGADQIFARAALGLGVPLIGVVPFEDYPADFDEGDRAAFDTLLALCAEVHRLPRKRRSNQAYWEAGKWVVDRVEFLVAVWNGLPAAGFGGTGDVVAYARKKGCKVFRIDPDPQAATTNAQ